MEDVAEAGGEDGCGGRVEGLKLSVGAYIDKVHLQSRGQKLAIGKYAHKLRVTYRNDPSVRTLRSCNMNQTPIWLSGSVNLKALTHRLPIRFLVNIPLGWERGSQEPEGERSGP